MILGCVSEALYNLNCSLQVDPVKLLIILFKLYLSRAIKTVLKVNRRFRQRVRVNTENRVYQNASTTSTRKEPCDSDFFEINASVDVVFLCNRVISFPFLARPGDLSRPKSHLTCLRLHTLGSATDKRPAVVQACIVCGTMLSSFPLGVFHI